MVALFWTPPEGRSDRAISGTPCPPIFVLRRRLAATENHLLDPHRLGEFSEAGDGRVGVTVHPDGGITPGAEDHHQAVPRLLRDRGSLRIIRRAAKRPVHVKQGEPARYRVRPLAQ